MNLFMATVFLAAILGVRGQDPDPTAVCYPSSFQAKYFNMLTEDTGHIYVDFNKELYVEASTVSGDIFIHDFAKLRSYAVTDNSTICTAFSLLPSRIMNRCLSAYAKYVPEATGFLYYVRDSSLKVQTWDIQTDYDAVYRMVYVSAGDSKVVPVISHQFGYHGTTELFLYTSHVSPVIDNNTVFIPDICS